MRCMNEHTLLTPSTAINLQQEWTRLEVGMQSARPQGNILYLLWYQSIGIARKIRSNILEGSVFLRKCTFSSQNAPTLL